MPVLPEVDGAAGGEQSVFFCLAEHLQGYPVLYATAWIPALQLSQNLRPQAAVGGKPAQPHQGRPAHQSFYRLINCHGLSS